MAPGSVGGIPPAGQVLGREGGEGGQALLPAPGGCQGPLRRGGRALHNRAGGPGSVPCLPVSHACPEPYSDTHNFSFFCFVLSFVSFFPRRFTGPKERGRCCARRDPAALGAAAGIS